MSTSGLSRPLDALWLRAQLWLRLLLWGAAVCLAAWIALSTPFDMHPDEGMHVDAFKFYETHWLPPQVGDPSLLYDQTGRSRAYYGEGVYWLYGRLGAVLPLPPGDVAGRFYIYRLFNLILWAAGLAGLLFGRLETTLARRLALTMLCLPQVIYTHGYANSDAWGLWAGAYLFLWTVHLLRRPISAWRWPESLLLGVLAGAVLGAKSSFLVALVLPGVLVAWHAIAGMTSAAQPEPRRSAIGRTASRLMVAALVALLIGAPLKLLRPLTTPDYAARKTAMQEAYAVAGFKPSDPSYPTLQPADKGMTVFSLLTGTPWVLLSTASFYGVFGALNLWLPRFIYPLAALAALGLLLLGAQHWRSTRHSAPAAALEYRLYALAPFAVALNVLAALAFSLYIEFQPQGRYFFATLAPISLLLFGPGLAPPRSQRRQRLLVALLLALAFAGSAVVIFKING